ncbi:protein with role in RNA processing [Chytriomyces hyalinus]|nr:protein with role in RNA processing [Chytriomyces hyalinus]
MSANANANTVNANEAAAALVGAHVRAVLVNETQYSGLVVVYERTAGLLVLQAKGSSEAKHNFHFLKVTAIKHIERVQSQPARPAAQIPANAPPQQTQQPAKPSAWSLKAGAPTAAQIVAGKASTATPAATTSSSSPPTPLETAVPPPPSALVQINTSAPFNFQKISQRRQAAVNAARESADKIGVNVSKRAQDIFNALDKTLPTRWKGDAIIVLDEVMIMAPYGIDDVRGITPTSATAVDRVQKVLEQVMKRFTL